MTDDPECGECGSPDSVMKRAVGPTELKLCPGCADRKRAVHGQQLASRPPSRLNSPADGRSVADGGGGE